VTSIAIDRNGMIWVGTDKGISSFNGTNWTSYSWESYTSDELHGELKGNKVYSIAVDSNNVKWFGTEWSGAASFNGTTWTIYTPENSGIKHHGIYRIAVDSSDQKWFIYDKETPVKIISKFDGTNWSDYRTDGPLDNTILSIGTDPYNKKWIGTLGGTSVFDGVSWSYPVPTGFPQNWHLYDIAVDSDGVYWLGTESGLVRYDGSEWKVFNTENSGLLDNYIFSVTVTKDNVIWCGVRSKRVVCYDGFSWTPYLTTSTDDNYIDIDDNNVVWVVAATGLYSYNGISWAFYKVPDALGYNYVRNFGIDHDNVKWIETSSDVTSFDGSTWKNFFTYEREEYVHGVYCMCADNNNTIWFGYDFWGINMTGAYNGVMSYDGISWHYYKKELDSFIQGRVNDIAVDNDNVKWFATNYGLVSYDDLPDHPLEIQSCEVQAEFTIIGNYPNPFNTSTVISFSIPYDSFASLTVYSISGQRVKELVSQHLIAGIHNVQWNGLDENGTSVSSGIYLIKLYARSMQSVKKIVYIK
jgi:ligand-binding sensor domain-containing protein